ncbi:MAG: DUF2586 family protein [Bacteroides sp.]|nr:DUF2586 family protein [Bacteroides sp.]MCM1086309.1 DUF2586 family protein [Bacteroides sp.]
MALPGVEIEIGNGGLGRVTATSDGVAGLLLTGAEVKTKAVNDKGVETETMLFELGKHYQLSSTKDLSALGITAENNPLVDHEVRSFYAQAGDGAELHLMVVANGTKLTAMVNGTESSLGKLIESAAGRIKLVGVNRLEEENETPDLEKKIDGDAITAAEKAHQTAESYAGKIMPFRVFLPAPHWTGETGNELYSPSGSSYNRVAMVLASEGAMKIRESKEGEDAAPDQYPAAIGMVLGRAAKAEPQQDLGRVKFGSIASDGYFTNGSKFLDKQGVAGILNDAGYIFFLNYPSKNGCYLNGCPMACDAGDDYAVLNNGRIIDKAMRIAYDTYISEIMDNVQVGSDGKLPSGVCSSFESMIENAVASLMDGQISSFKAYVDPSQNILSTSTLKVECSIVPLGVLKTIKVVLAFSNPALEQ